MSGHTPGPWKIDGGIDEKTGDMFIWQAGDYFGGHAIARVYQDAGETKANARLIAAAPELYELAKSVRSELAYVIAKTGVGDTILEQQLGEIIAKAEGR